MEYLTQRNHYEIKNMEKTKHCVDVNSINSKVYDKSRSGGRGLIGQPRCQEYINEIFCFGIV